MLIGISVLLIFTMLFNVKFHKGVNAVFLDDNALVYYSFSRSENQSKMTLDFSNVSANVKRFSLQRDKTIYKESTIGDSADINNIEIDMGNLESGRYMMKLTTDKNLDMIEEIELP